MRRDLGLEEDDSNYHSGGGSQDESLEDEDDLDDETVATAATAATAANGQRPRLGDSLSRART